MLTPTHKKQYLFAFGYSFFFKKIEGNIALVGNHTEESETQRTMKLSLAFWFTCYVCTSIVNADDPLPTELSGETLEIIPTNGDANQGVGVDDQYIYAVTNRRITKIRKETGKLLTQWDGDDDFPEGHFDSGVIVGDFLYVAQANWPAWPMASTVEIFDRQTMEHVGTHSLGIQIGSFTWLDRYNGYWWGGFANYDRYQGGAMDSYGKGHNVQVVRMDDDFQIQEMWQIPDEGKAKQLRHRCTRKNLRWNNPKCLDSMFGSINVDI